MLSDLLEYAYLITQSAATILLLTYVGWAGLYVTQSTPQLPELLRNILTCAIGTQILAIAFLTAAQRTRP